ncbi:zinc-dependent alcohol dehydrogenase [Streptomonospora litoralis]|uniref:Sorbitol dehydrogenase n=1 Tax=Streptomonospora litoralis TaxID=2498135 RepID=A0A4P6Q244_9ACTN|nr:alcohol dehydrogenase catalytic domain-containing protein [Streptomonospora litoralis]QBI54573.1 Sorbitol dehydrogenase [Streptomonospora litoralis]
MDGRTPAAGDTMPALRWHGPRDLRLDTVAVPEPGPGTVLVAVERVGLCGTDLEEYTDGPVQIPAAAAHPLSDRRAPVVLGHEVVGRVAACPGGELRTGARVVPDVVVGCGRCWWCGRHQPGLCPTGAVRGLQDDGGLAHYMAADAARAVEVPEHVPADAAGFAEPLSVAVRALRKAGDLSGACVAVLGAGTIGLLTAAVAAARGAGRVLAVDPVATRRRLAEGFGAAAAPPDGAADLVGDASCGRGADVVVECSGTPPAAAQAPLLARRGGTVVLVGTPPPGTGIAVREVVAREQRVLGSVAHIWDEDTAAAVALLSRGTIDPSPLLSAVVRLEDAVHGGFERLLRDRDALKVLVAPGPAEAPGGAPVPAAPSPRP